MARKEVLTENNKQFALEYVMLGNALQAYMRAYPKAGYTTARVQSSVLRKKKVVEDEINRIRKEYAEQLKVEKNEVVDAHRQTIDTWNYIMSLAHKENKTKAERTELSQLSRLVSASDVAKATDQLSRLFGFYETPEEDGRKTPTTFNFNLRKNK